MSAQRLQRSTQIVGSSLMSRGATIHPPNRSSILKRGVRCTLKAARKLRGFVRQTLGISKVQFVEQSNTIHYFDKDANEYNFDDMEEPVEVANECEFDDDTQTEPRTRVE